MAGRAPAAARRRTSSPRRIDLRQPLPDRVVQDIERELEALAPEGPALAGNVTSISAAGDVAPDAGDALDAAMSFDPPVEERAPTPDAGDGRDDWSEQDLADYADAMERSAAVDAPDPEDEMPEDHGWAEYAASLEAQDGPPAEPADASLPPPPRDPTPPPAVTPPKTRTQTAFEDLDRRRLALYDVARQGGGPPVLSPDWPQLRAAASALLSRPDLSGPQRAIVTEFLARGRLDAINMELAAQAEDLASMTLESRKAGLPLDSHPDYADWRARGAGIQHAAGDVPAALAQVAHPDHRQWYDALLTPKFTDLDENLRRAALLADARRELAPAAVDLKARHAAVLAGARRDLAAATADLKVRHAVVRQTAVREYDTFLKDTQKHHFEAQAAGVHPNYHRGADDLYRRATRLRDKDYLPEAHRTEIAAFCHRVETFTAARDLVRDVDDQLQNQAAKQFVHQIHVTPSADQHTPLLHRSETPEYPEWARKTDELLPQAAAIAADPETYRAHLDHAPELRDRLAQNAELLTALRADDTGTPPGDALLTDLRERSLAVADEALQDGIHWIDHPDTPELLKHADLLTARPDLSPPSRDAVTHFRAQYDSAVEPRRDAERLDAQLQAHFASRSAMHRASMDANHTISDHRDYGAWKSRTDDLLQQIELLVGDPDDRAALSMASPGLGSSLAHDGEILAKAIADDARYLALSRSPPRQHIPAVPAPLPTEHAIPPLPDPQTINDQLEAYWDARQPIRQAAIAASQPTAAHPDYDTWKTRTEALMQTAQSILSEAGPYEDALDADPTLRSHLELNIDLLSTTIATDMRLLKIAAPDPRPAIETTPKSEDDQAPDISPDFDEWPKPRTLTPVPLPTCIAPNGKSSLRRVQLTREKHGRRRSSWLSSTPASDRARPRPKRSRT